MANKEKIECVGLCKGLAIVIEGCPIVADFYVLPVAACPMVLGIQWLATLGPVEMDYAQLTITFKLHNQFYSFKGMRNHGLGVLTDKESSWGPRGYGTAFRIQILSTESSSTNTPYPLDLNQLLSNFSLVFQPPTILPPKRPHDHRIPLLPNTPPINVRPYRYPHYQKSEIEKIVREMLQIGLIRPSNSPFSSPVLLVNKASGEWRFCINYRALNTITIKDKYKSRLLTSSLMNSTVPIIFRNLIFDQATIKSEFKRKIFRRWHSGPMKDTTNLLLCRLASLTLRQRSRA